MVRADISGELATTFGTGLVLAVAVFFVFVAVIVSIIATAHWTRRSALELKAIRQLLEKRQAAGEDLPSWLSSDDRPSQHSA